MYSLLLVITLLLLFLLMSNASLRRFLYLLGDSLAFSSVSQFRPLDFRLLLLWIMFLDLINLWRNASRYSTLVLGIAILVALSLFVLFVLILV